MRIENCLIASLAWLFPALAIAQQGPWEPEFPFGNTEADAIVAVHLIHVYDEDAGRGKAVALTEEAGSDILICNSLDHVSHKARLWSFPLNGVVGPGSFEAIPLCRTYMFCGGHSALDDGSILVIGGTDSNMGEAHGTKHANLFVPDYLGTGPGWNPPSQMMPPPNMNYARWYPTATTMWDGRLFVHSGWDENGEYSITPEIFTPNSPWDPEWVPVPSANMPENEETLYPWMFVLPDQNLVNAGPGVSRILKTSNWTWGSPLPDPFWWGTGPPPTPPGQDGSVVMYEPGKIMKCGGRNPVVATTFVVDLNGANPDDPPRWMYAGNMIHARADHTLTNLPDGKILALGGATVHMGEDPVKWAEIYDPAAGTWTEQPQSASGHKYHSTVMLLPDSRVVLAGGVGNPTAQIFKPPYITSGAPRPIIDLNTAPTFMQYGQQYTIEYDPNDGPEATKACLIRLSSGTHGFDQDQRRVPLSVQGMTSEPPTYSMVVNAPADGNIAPPGYYMLFILNEYERNKYAPCMEAKYVRVGP